jgi:hypothetical protein
MDFEKAIDKLTHMIADDPDVLDTFREASDDWADARKLAIDLITWFNISEPGSGDIKRLLILVREGRFRAWDCPTCETRVYLGEPEAWGYFQGVRNADYCSFPGYNIGSDDRRCDSCRMWMKGYMPDGYHLEAD